MLCLHQFLSTRPSSIYNTTLQNSYLLGTHSFYSLHNSSTTRLFIFTLASLSVFCLTMLNVALINFIDLE